MTLLHLQPDLHFSDVYERARLAPRRGVYHIAMWGRETDIIPEIWKVFFFKKKKKKSWKMASRSTDEVWAPSRYVADGLCRALDIPVYPVHSGFRARYGPASRSKHLRFPTGSFVFLFIFDLGTTLARKNPLGLISAFRQAFRHNENATLFIKAITRSQVPRTNPTGFKSGERIGAIIIDQSSKGRAQRSDRGLQPLCLAASERGPGSDHPRGDDAG